MALQGPKRSYYDPIKTMPAARTSSIDDHHLMFPGADMRTYGLSQLRDCKCAQVKLDPMVHTLVHARYVGIPRLTSAQLADIARRAQLIIDQHNQKRCACYPANTHRLCVVDALSLEATSTSSYRGRPCIAIAIDGQVYELMRRYYRPIAPVSDEIYRQLQLRCDNHVYSCYVERSGKRIHAPSIGQRLTAS